MLAIEQHRESVVGAPVASVFRQAGFVAKEGNDALGPVPVVGETERAAVGEAGQAQRRTRDLRMPALRRQVIQRIIQRGAGAGTGVVIIRPAREIDAG